MTPASRVIACIGLLLALMSPVTAAAASEETAAAVGACLECHDYGEDAPVHQVLMGSHGIEGDSPDMAGRRGCIDCHGDSQAHSENPQGTAPDTSFGPRWSASAGAQDQRCLACHEDDMAGNWRHALHMFNNITCVTCHDVHAAEDRVLFEEQQARVCTTCHKAQRSGIHNLGDSNDDPPCSSCHNPHDHESAATRMRENQSVGCVYCHDEAQMSGLAALNNKAGNYHRVMADPARTCIDCHQGIAHAPEDSAPPIHASAVRGRTVTLFYPGDIDRQWLLREHPGSQPLRQGANCQRCHRGDEAQLGAAIAMDAMDAGGAIASHRAVDIAFSLQDDSLHIELGWEGSATDRQVALMWGDTHYRGFRQGGCFAACHGDGDSATTLTGKSAYGDLSGAASDAAATMGNPAIAGFRAELWRIPLGPEAPETAMITDSINPQATNEVAVQRRYEDGNWRVSLQLQLERAGSGIHFSREGRYTFGIALHGADNPGRQHWVSLPMSLAFTGQDTDFIASDD